MTHLKLQKLQGDITQQHIDTLTYIKAMC